MDRNAIWKWLILIGLVAWSLAIALPIAEKWTLGLDLRGGTSFLLAVDTSELDENDPDVSDKFDDLEQQLEDRRGDLADAEQRAADAESEMNGWEPEPADLDQFTEALESAII